jgi:hypothetical protein
MEGEDSMPLSNYDVLACKLIDLLNGDILPLPRWGDPERNQQRIVMAVCEGSAMTPEHWATLGETEREPWVEKTIERLHGRSNSGLEQAEAIARQEFDAAQELAVPVAVERELRDRLWAAWNQIYVPLGLCHHPINYRGWSDKLNAFCEVVRREDAKFAGLLDRFTLAQSPNPNEQIALNLIRAGLLDSEQGIGHELAKLAQSDDRDWMKVFNMDDLLYYVLDCKWVGTPTADADPCNGIVVRYTSAAAKFNKAIDVFDRRMRQRGMDPKLVVVIHRGDLGSGDPPRNVILTDDSDWLAFKLAANDFEALKREWEESHPGMLKGFQDWERAELAEFQRVYGQFSSFDTSVDETGKPNNPQQYQTAQQHNADLARHAKQRREWLEKLCAPPIPVPDGWEGEPPRYEITTLNDAEPWLERELEHVRGMQGFSAAIGHDAGIHAINNLYRLFDQLRISDRPNAPTDPPDKIRVELVLSDLLAWVRTRLSTDAQAKANSANGQPTPDVQTMPTSPLDGFRGRVASAYKKLLFALDQDEREPLPDGDDGIPRSRVNQLLEELRPLDADGAIDRAYKAARANVSDRDVPLVEEIYKAFWRVVENVMRGRSDGGDNYRFQHALTMRPQIDRESEPKTVLSSGEWSTTLPPEFDGIRLVSLCLTTPEIITEHLARLRDGRFFIVRWDSRRVLYHWSPVTESCAKEKAEPVRVFCGRQSWLELFDIEPSKVTQALPPESDGPQPPNKFLWQGKCAELQPIPWKLVDFLWKAENHTAEIEAVFDGVWGDDSTRSDSALKTAISRANTALLEKEIPVTVSQKSGHVSLTVAAT